MLSRTTYSLVSLALLTAVSCARQEDPENIFDDGDDDADGGTLSVAGTPSKAGTTSVGTSGTSSVPKGGSSSLPTGKSGSKNGGSGGTSSAGSSAGGGGSGGTGGSGTMHMPVDGMAVQFKPQDTSEAPVDFVGGELYVFNNEATEFFMLPELKIRYYLTNEVTDVMPGFVYQWGNFGTMNQTTQVVCNGTLVPMAAPKPGADSYIEFTCSTEGILEAGTRLVMSWKVGAQGMGKMVQTDDYSFAMTQADNEKIVVLNGNTVIWGVEP
jgi:endoglucanase